MFSEHFTTKRIDFDLPDGFAEAGAFKPILETAHAGE
jgi:hypothetical protein